ncbi:MAG TPA: hypothetical protein VJS64_14915, partial [Pyrinomonadaceae bacterium]|nr:hypothetical protein [Pyrinomonadaceae bacterium]
MNRKLSSFVMAGLVAGTLDISYAILFSYFRSGVSPTRVLHSVASGLLGREAYSGGLPIAALGLGLHFFIAFTATAVFFLGARHLPLLVRHPIISGVVYGTLIYAVMNYVVIPLSRVPPRTAPPAKVVMITGLLVHMFFIGVPIALGAR